MLDQIISFFIPKKTETPAVVLTRTQSAADISVEISGNRNSNSGNIDRFERSGTKLPINEEKYNLLLEMDDKKLNSLKTDIITIVVDVMDMGVMEEKLSTAINNAKDKIDKLSWDSQIKEIAYFQLVFFRA